jgi:hypothetical protein
MTTKETLSWLQATGYRSSWLGLAVIRKLAK